MTTYIVLLRGINVSGKNKLPMQELRQLLIGLGYQKVQTYIQSGNIILETDEEKSKIIQKIQDKIQQKFDYKIPVMLRTIDHWKKIIDHNPYPKENEKILSVTFLSEVPKKKTIEITLSEGDYFTIREDVVYIYCLGGVRNSKLTINLFEKLLNVMATNRNWRTTNKLLKLAIK